eukprot:304478_1
MEIIDPVNIKHNIAKNVGHDQYTRIKQEFHRSYQICNSHKQSKKCTKSLFDKLTSEYIPKAKINNGSKKCSNNRSRKRKRDSNDYHHKFKPPSHKRRRIY